MNNVYAIKEAHMQLSDSTVKAVAVQSAMRLLDEAGARIQQAIQLLRDSGQEALAQKVTESALPEEAEPGQGAYKKLMQKLLLLTDRIDDMSDTEWNRWVSTLPQEEFFEFIAVSGDEETFRAAMADARAAVAPDQDEGFNVSEAIGFFVKPGLNTSAVRKCCTMFAKEHVLLIGEGAYLAATLIAEGYRVTLWPAGKNVDGIYFPDWSQVDA